MFPCQKILLPNSAGDLFLDGENVTLFEGLQLRGAPRTQL